MGNDPPMDSYRVRSFVDRCDTCGGVMLSWYDDERPSLCSACTWAMFNIAEEEVEGITDRFSALEKAGAETAKALRTLDAILRGQPR